MNLDFGENNLLVYGAAGTGKSTQAKIIAHTFGLRHLNMGDMLRAAVNNKTETGLVAKEFMDAGDLVPDKIACDIIFSEITDDFVLDGFPRNLHQSKRLVDFLEQKQKSIKMILHLIAPEDILLNRLLSRHREDDDVDIIKHRISVCNTETNAIINFLSVKYPIYSIDASDDVESVQRRIISCIEKVRA